MTKDHRVAKFSPHLGASAGRRQWARKGSASGPRRGCTGASQAAAPRARPVKSASENSDRPL